MTEFAQRDQINLSFTWFSLILVIAWPKFCQKLTFGLSPVSFFSFTPIFFSISLSLFFFLSLSLSFSYLDDFF